MSKYLTDESRALIIAFFPDLFTVIQQFGLYDFTTDQLNIALSISAKVVIGFFYFVKIGQSKGPSA